VTASPPAAGTDSQTLEVLSLFEAKAPSWAAKYAEDGPLTARLTSLSAAVSAHARPGDRVLDLGCGTGDLAWALAAAGFRVTGCDISGQMLRRAARDDGGGVALGWVQLEPGWRTLPFAASAFDVVVASSVLEYVTDPAAVLRECTRVTRAGGAVLYTVPDLRHPVRWAEWAARRLARMTGQLSGPRWWHGYHVYLRASWQRHRLRWWLSVSRQAGLSPASRPTDRLSALCLLAFRCAEDRHGGTTVVGGISEQAEPGDDPGSELGQPLRVLLVADTQSSTAWGWVDAVRSAGVTVLGADGKPWPHCPVKPNGEKGLAIVVRRRLGCLSAKTRRRLIAIQKLRRLAGPSLALLRGWRLRRVINATKPDLVHALRIPYEGMAAAAACPSGVPLAISIWGNDLTLHAGVNRLVAHATRKVLARADLLYADCQRDLDLAKAWRLRPTVSTALLPGGGGIDLTGLTESSRPGQMPPGISVKPDQRIVVNARGLREYVRNDTLLRALSILSPDIDPRVRVVFVGASQDKSLREEITRHPLAGKIMITGQLSPDEMMCLFRQAEVSVSITDHDGTPNSLLEAMAAGAVPVCGDIPSIREWIESGTNGFLARPNDPHGVAEALRAALNLSSPEREAIIYENRQIVAARAERRATGREAAKRYQSLISPS